jgi:hypothetical protein
MRVATTPNAVMTTDTNAPVRARLTEEQSELVQGLLRHNVSLPTVVGAIEGMLRGDRYSGGDEDSGVRITRNDGRPEMDNPPDYDSIQQAL